MKRSSIRSVILFSYVGFLFPFIIYFFLSNKCILLE